MTPVTLTIVYKRCNTDTRKMRTPDPLAAVTD